MLSGLLDAAARLVLDALGLQRLVVGLVTDPLLGLALEPLGLVVGLVLVTHGITSLLRSYLRMPDPVAGKTVCRATPGIGPSPVERSGVGRGISRAFRRALGCAEQAWRAGGGAPAGRSATGGGARARGYTPGHARRKPGRIF